ncbi:very short patch repair endonuclease [Cellulomonas sp. P22]|uniref:very short patch repair endonuclease n=1 Tax=Cellulomonas sp. P22 TaxID=3373189 RepID=UPI0037A2EE93
MTTFHVPSHPGSSGAGVSQRMSRLPRRDNDRERALRSALHARGFRYRVAYKIPGLPRRSIDIAFTRARVAVFLDGCFWHGCPEHGTQPRSNRDWWSQKIAANRGRDADTTAHLEAAGWRVVRIWEHRPLQDAVDAVVAEVEHARLADRPPTAGGPSDTA